MSNRLTIQLSILLWFALITPAWADPMTLDFATNDGMAGGTFSYETTAAPTSTHTLGGSTYTLSSWNMFANGNSTALPLTTFSSEVPLHTGQLCVGACTFAAPQQLRLDFKGEGFWFFFSFNINEPLTTPPTFEQIGTFRQAAYRPESELVPVRVWGNAPGSTATLTQGAVPEPATLSSLAIGLILLRLGSVRCFAHRKYPTHSGQKISITLEASTGCPRDRI